MKINNYVIDAFQVVVTTSIVAFVGYIIALPFVVASSIAFHYLINIYGRKTRTIRESIFASLLAVIASALIIASWMYYLFS